MGVRVRSYRVSYNTGRLICYTKFVGKAVYFSAYRLKCEVRLEGLTSRELFNRYVNNNNNNNVFIILIYLSVNLTYRLQRTIIKNKIS